MQGNNCEFNSRNTAGLQRAWNEEQESYQDHRYLPCLVSPLLFYLILMASMCWL